MSRRVHGPGVAFASILISTLVTACLWWAIGAQPATAEVGHVKLFDLPVTQYRAGGIAAGPGRNVWFTFGDRIGRITHTGKMRFFPLHSGYLATESITTGADGNLWFNEWKPGELGAIGKMTPAGTVTDFVLPTGTFGDLVAAGPDGNVWFTANERQIGRITPSGSVGLFDVPSRPSDLTAIGAGPDGNVWFGERGPCRISKITPAGHITEYEVPGTRGSDEFDSIVAGPNGNIWFTKAHFRGWIAELTPGGTLVDRWVPKQGLHPSGLTVDGTGNLWYVADDGGLVGRFSGRKFEYFTMPLEGVYPVDTIAFGADGDVWLPVGRVGSFAVARVDAS